MKKTAIQNLIEAITKSGVIIINQEVIDEALRDEKENIETAWTDGFVNGDADFNIGDDYYNETFDVKI